MTQEQKDVDLSGLQGYMTYIFNKNEGFSYTEDGGVNYLIANGKIFKEGEEIPIREAIEFVIDHHTLLNSFSYEEYERLENEGES